MNKSGSTPPDISVVICAYSEERWDCLLKAIESLTNQTLRPWEIIVVIDHNPSLFNRLRQSVPGIIVAENRGPRGLSGGRNTGIALAQGDAIAFLDDDAEAASNWLQQLAQWFRYEEVVGVGGAVEPNWEAEAPSWFPREFGWVVGCSYEGQPEKSSAVRNLFGGCMCVRREAFDLVGGFRNNIGRGEGGPMGCEETELCIRVQQKRPDWRFIYEPQARIYHRIPHTRTTWAYFRQRCYAEGLSKAQVAQLVGAGDGLSTERSYTLRTLPLGVLQGLGDVVLQRKPAGLLRLGAIIGGLTYTVLGYAAGLMSQTQAVPEKAVQP